MKPVPPKAQSLVPMANEVKGKVHKHPRHPLLVIAIAMRCLLYRNLGPGSRNLSWRSAAAGWAWFIPQGIGGVISFEFYRYFDERPRLVT